MKRVKPDVSRMGVALGLYGALAAAAWWMVDNTPISVGFLRVGMRTLTFVVLGLFVFRTLMHRYRQRLEAESATATAGVTSEQDGRE